MPHPYAQERIWFDKSRVEEAEVLFYQHKYGVSGGKASVSTPATPLGSLAAEISKVRDCINKALAQDPADAALSPAEMKRIEKLESENRELRTIVSKLEARIASLELSVGSGGVQPPKASCAAAVCSPAKGKEAPAAPAKDEAEDDDIDLFGSDDEVDEEAERIKAERVAAYAEKKSKKPELIAKSMILLDVKPWDDETDMAELEKSVRTIEMDGLVWGASKLLPVGYGIKKLQISCVVEDAKVSVDDLEEKITGFEDYVQSVDIAAFNKI